MAILCWSSLEVTLRVSTGSTGFDTPAARATQPAEGGYSTRSGEARSDRVADLHRRALRIAAGGKVGLNGRVDPGGGLTQSEVVQHERNREDGCGRVCELLARDVGRRAVHRLEHAGERTVRVDVPR